MTRETIEERTAEESLDDTAPGAAPAEPALSEPLDAGEGDPPPTDGLFDSQVVLAPSDDTAQWRAEELQLVNWGGFTGLTRVPLGAAATMISGASGVGKSTILDAYTALMMPSDTKFNGASNDAVSGRARGVGQRNLLSYLRGAVDVVDDPRTGKPVERLLRGQGVDTWGAVAMTFRNDSGGRFTVARTYYVGRRATRSADVSMQLLTLEAPLSLATLEHAVGDRFHANSLKKLYPGVRVHRTYAEFSAVLHARLGIGASGDGAKALRLLARIQAGNQVRSVDELYKDMVLERPATYAAADRAVAHFDDLDAAYDAMRTEEAKLELLGPITELESRRKAATSRRADLDAYGVTATGDSPLRLWLLRTHARLLDAGVAANREARTRVADELATAGSAEATLAADLEAAKEAHTGAGGGTLQQLAGALEQEQAVLATRETRRDALAERLRPLATEALETGSGEDPLAALDDAAAFARLQSDARARLAGAEQESEALRAERDAVRDRRYPLQARQSELRAERASLEVRGGRVPARMHEMRDEVAAACGLDPSDLPYVAELLDVAPEHSRWRTAVETVLGGTARMMLVPLDRLSDFSRAIDGLHLRGRLVFEGAELDLPVPGEADPDRVAGKVVLADTPFAGWVARHVREPSRNALCVEQASGLAGSGLRVTLAGQTRSGRRGTHGRSDPRPIIGFSNGDALGDLDAELTSLEAQLRDVDADVELIDRRAARTEQRRAASDALVAARFDDLDVAASARRIAELEQRRADILGSDDDLQVRQAQVGELEQRLDEARQHRFALEQRRRTLAEEHAELVDAQDLVADRLEATERSGRIVLTGEQDAALREEMTAAVAPADPDDLARFTENSQRLAARLRDAVAEAETEMSRAEDELAAVFRLYQARWPSPNLGSGAASYADYARILEQVRGTGLAERRAEWRRRLTEWSGQDLVPLLGAMSSSVEDIEDRLEPINTILRRLEFGGAGDRLRIRLRRLSPAHVGAFLKDLRALAAGDPGQLDEAGLEKRFTDLARFMTQLRPSAVPGETSDRDRLLDVRRHVEISAERFDAATGELRATYRTLGEKSGGESQELVAFIVGSALRFRLGDELRSRPRFAPVFLDEGFVKADSEFAGRAVRAWKGLGFQLVIGVPLDKVTGLEPHMDELLAITKNPTTHRSWITPVSPGTD
ncbi:ATP-binding protein [Nocardioides bruguierae]|uniref:AAA family ATPase n=1 Tax=Nocardioides bruguierae TaxID=2945102 RepID=A0A9X2IDX3_9ACTN|nr:SbcC/MukB-like Walker B domain-containing protein [Nocardioides bruguierae]MCM0619478.1 hypothetical protein [Nocardioides bruguierae]